MSFETSAQAVQWIMMIACALMGVSHIVRPSMWVTYFEQLRVMGQAGAVLNAQFTLIPGLFIVVLHQIWTWPDIVLTLYGWALLIKSAVILLSPETGQASMEMAQKGRVKFLIAGGGLLLVAAASGAALFMR
jgi:hypothetical protein